MVHNSRCDRINRLQYKVEVEVLGEARTINTTASTHQSCITYLQPNLATLTESRVHILVPVCVTIVTSSHVKQPKGWLINSLGPKFLSLGHFQSIEHLNFCSLVLLGSKLLTQVISA